MPIVWSPPATSSRSSHTNHASAPSSTGTPCATVWVARANFSSATRFDAKTLATSCWPARSTLTAKRRDSRTTGSVRESLSKHTSSSTGSSESDVIAFVVSPAWPLGPLAVTTATPVGNEPIALRKRRAVVTRRRPYPLPPVWKTTARDTLCDRQLDRRRAVRSSTRSFALLPHDQLAVLAQVVVVGDRADHPVLARPQRVERERRRLAGLRGARPAELGRRRLAVLLVLPDDLQVVRQAPDVGRDDPQAAGRDVHVLGDDPELLELHAKRPLVDPHGVVLAACGEARGGEREGGEEGGAQGHGRGHSRMVPARDDPPSSPAARPAGARGVRVRRLRQGIDR